MALSAFATSPAFPRYVFIALHLSNRQKLTKAQLLVALCESTCIDHFWNHATDTKPCDFYGAGHMEHSLSKLPVVSEILSPRGSVISDATLVNLDAAVVTGNGLSTGIREARQQRRSLVAQSKARRDQAETDEVAAQQGTPTAQEISTPTDYERLPKASKGLCGYPGMTCADNADNTDGGNNEKPEVQPVPVTEDKLAYKGLCGYPGMTCADDGNVDTPPSEKREVQPDPRLPYKGLCGYPGMTCAETESNVAQSDEKRDAQWQPTLCGYPGMTCADDGKGDTQAAEKRDTQTNTIVNDDGNILEVQTEALST